MTISERIFEIMRIKNIKQKELSENINIPTATISTWNTRNTSPPAEKIVDIASFLGVSIEYLLTGEEKGNNFNSIHVSGSVGNNSINNNYAELDKHDRELLEEYNKLSLKNKAKVINLITELEERDN